MHVCAPEPRHVHLHSAFSRSCCVWLCTVLVLCLACAVLGFVLGFVMLVLCLAPEWRASGWRYYVWCIKMHAYASLCCGLVEGQICRRRELMVSTGLMPGSHKRMHTHARMRAHTRSTQHTQHAQLDPRSNEDPCICIGHTHTCPFVLQAERGVGQPRPHAGGHRSVAYDPRCVWGEGMRRG